MGEAHRKLSDDWERDEEYRLAYEQIAQSDDATPAERSLAAREAAAFQERLQAIERVALGLTEIKEPMDEELS